MKPIKFFALAIGAIALLPSVSLADNVSGNSQEANLSSTTVGSGNVTVQDVQQRIVNLQNAGTPCQTGTPCATPAPTPEPPCGINPCVGSTPLPTPSTSGTNVGGTSLKVNANTTTVGYNNVDVKRAVQEAINIQQAK